MSTFFHSSSSGRNKTEGHGKSNRSPKRRRQLLIETLEGRRLLATFEVTTVSDVVANDGFVSLREAIESANVLAGSDTITFASAIDGQPINLSGALGQLQITDSVTITGNGAAQTIIDANQQSRVLNIEVGLIDVSLLGMTITGGRTTGDNLNFSDSTQSGGGIRFLSSGALNLADSTLSGNSTAGNGAHGGGIYTSSGSVTLTGSTLSGNSTAGGAHGGGIFTSSGSVTLMGSTLSGNSTAGDHAAGGGIFTSSGSVTLTSSKLSGNRTSGNSARGGGILTVTGSVTLTGSTLSGNSTAGDDATGGGIQLGTDSSSVTLTGSTLSGNNTSGKYAHGGGIHAYDGSVTLTGSTLSGNQVIGTNSDGGGLWFNDSVVTIVSSTITGNSASRAGGGLGMYASLFDKKLTIHNSIIAGNTAATQPDFTAPTNPGTNLQVKSSLIGNNVGTSLTASATADPNGNRIGAPGALIHPLLGPLQDNGGPTLTHALLPGSPAIDAGDNALLAGQTTDQRGVPFIRTFNATVDIGAYERHTLVTLPLVVTTLTDELDYSNAEVSLREAIDSANLRLGPDTITFTNGLTGTISLSLGQLQITDSVTITGNGATQTIVDANQQSRVLNIIGESIDVSFSGLTITGGKTTGHNLNYTDSTHSGGGIRFLSSGMLIVADSTLSGNSTTGDRAGGGGIYVSYGSVTLTRSTVSGNSTSGIGVHGGGIQASSGSVTMTGSTLSGNQANGTNSVGGGLWFNDSLVTIVSSTITGNTASATGGGLTLYDNVLDKKLTIHNSIIAGNTDNGTAPDFAAATNPGTNLEVKSSLIGNNVGTSLSASATADPNGNRIGAPGALIDPLLGPLQDNGGPTLTHALLPGSPAIDAGDNALLAGQTTDQRGVPFIRTFNATVDIGAYERHTLVALPFVVTTLTDELDYSNAQVSLREAIDSANLRLGPDTITFTNGLTGTISLSLGQLQITDSVTITGNGVTQTILDANQQSRVLSIVGGSIDVSLTGLTITGGKTTGHNLNYTDSTHSGGGIRFLSSGMLTLADSTLSGNSTAGDRAARRRDLYKLRQRDADGQHIVRQQHGG